MPFDDLLMARLVRQKRKFGRPIVSGLRTDNVDSLRAAIAKGMIDQDTLTDPATGTERFLLGLTPMQDGTVVMQ